VRSGGTEREDETPDLEAAISKNIAALFLEQGREQKKKKNALGGERVEKT